MADSDSSYCILSDSEEQSEYGKEYVEEAADEMQSKQLSYTVISPVKLNEIQVSKLQTRSRETFPTSAGLTTLPLTIDPHNTFAKHGMTFAKSQRNFKLTKSMDTETNSLCM